MQFDRQSKRLCRTKHPRRLIFRKSDALHEGVDCVCKFSLTGAPCRSDGRNNAAARTRNLFVACTLQPQLELMGAVSTENQMGMTIDQSGRDPPPAAIDPFSRVGVRWKVGMAARKGDTA